MTDSSKGSTPTIAILTGGGDVPGMNPRIKTLVYRAESEGIRVIGIRRGWGGILTYDPDDPEVHFKYAQALRPSDVRTIDRTGGTYLHTSRTNPSAVRKKDMPEHLQKHFEEGVAVKDLTSVVLMNLGSAQADGS